MRYFELYDEVNVRNRWHLSEVIGSSGYEPRLTRGLQLPCSEEQEWHVAVGTQGQPLEWCLTSFAVPVAKKRLSSAIVTVANGDVQTIRVCINGHQDFEVLNSVRVVRCLDETRSEFTKWTTNDHRSDLAGQYRMVTRLRIMSECVPADAHFFRVEGWLVALIISESVKEAMESVGCLGAKFVEVT